MDVDGVDVVVAPAVHGPSLGLERRSSADGVELVLGAQHVSEHDEGAYTGEVVRPDARSPRRHDRARRALRAPAPVPHGRRDRRAHRGGRAARGPRADGLRGGDRGGARRRRDRGRARPPARRGALDGARPSRPSTSSSPTSRCGRSAPAARRPPRTPRPPARTSAPWPTRASASGAGALRVLYGGSVDPENAGELVAPPTTSTACWWAARASRPPRSPRSWARWPTATVLRLVPPGGRSCSPHCSSSSRPARRSG